MSEELDKLKKKYVKYINKWGNLKASELGVIGYYLNRIADALERITIALEAKAIIGDLKIEGKQQFTQETLEVTEEVYIDNLKDVTLLEESESGLAYKVLKEGYTTWLAKSHIQEDIMPLPLGVLLKDIPLKEERTWILKKKKDGTPNLEWIPLGG